MKIKSIRKVKSESPIKMYDVVNATPNSNFLVNISSNDSTDDNYIVSHNCGFLDELNYEQGATSQVDGELAKKILKLYTTIKRRMESRYQSGGRLPGMLFLVSSKKSESDFLEVYLNRNKDKEYLAIVDEPLWVVKKDVMNYSGKTFKLLVGNRTLKSKILDDNEDIQSYLDNNARIIDVPIEHKEAFELDINSALMDIAGIALSANLKYIYYDKLTTCYKSYLSNPFTHNIITLGFDDDSSIQDYLVLNLLSKLDKSKPMFIHWDTSKSHDRTGLSMTTVVSSSVVKRLVSGEVSEVEDLIHKVVFAIGIIPKPGEEIPFYKIRNFIYYLTSIGYNIVFVSSDGYNSVDLLQILKLKGYNTGVLSVDRSLTPYETLRNAINENRLLLPYIPELETELLDIELDTVRGKVDHTATGCLVGDTKILTISGYISISELTNTDIIYSYDVLSNSIVNSSFKSLRVTKYVTELYKIVTDFNQVIICTDNHPILTINGYTQAKDLTINDILVSVMISNSNKFNTGSTTNSVNDLYYVNKSFIGQSYISKIDILKVDSTPVYDIEVPSYHNFVLANGLIVHNSKDISDAVAGSIYKSISYKELLSSVNKSNDFDVFSDINKPPTTLEDEFIF